MNSEAFPEFAEPTLASDAELDHIVDLRARQPKGTAKPAMRVDAGMLRDSGLLRTLPEFLGQLARANLETETLLANDPDAVRLELDDDEAAEQPHVEMNLFPGLVETQRRRQQQRMVLPNGRPLELPGSIDDNIGSEDRGSAGDAQSYRRHSSADEDSGNESDASTSTTASLHANIRKRKAGSGSDAEEASPPNKIRLHYQYPPPELRRFDMKRRKLITTPNPNAAPNDPFEATQPPASPTPSASSSGSSSSGGPTRVIKIRVPCSGSDSSRASSPDSQGSRVIVLRDPRASRPSSSASSQRSSPSRPVIRLKSPQKTKPAARSSIREGTPSRSSSPGSSSDGSSSSRGIKIKVVQRPRIVDEGVDAPKMAKKRLIEEIDE